MSHKKILILDTHPNQESLCSALVDRYFEGAKNGNFEIQRLNIRDLKFDPILHYGYSKQQPLEEDLLKAQELIKWCQHLVIATPMWWAGVPALFKGFIDRTFIKGFSHYFDVNKKFPIKLLTNKTATVIYTQGAPWIYTFLMGNSMWSMLKQHVLKFSGFTNIKKIQIDKAKNISERRMNNIFKEIYLKGIKGY